MQKHYNYLNIDLDKKIHTKLKAKQGDSKSRYILVNLISNSTYYNLTGTTVKIYGIKKDKTIFFNHATVTNAKQGQFEIELTNQALAVPGEIEIQILILGTNEEKLTTFSFFINVEKTIIDDAAIESTNEFTALTNALSEVQDIDNKFTKVNEQFNTIETKIEEPISLNKCDEEMLGAIQNKEGETTFELLSIPREKSVDYSKVKDTDFYTIDKDWLTLNNKSDSTGNWGNNIRYKKGFVKNITIGINSESDEVGKTFIYRVYDDGSVKVVKEYDVVGKGEVNISINRYIEHDFYVTTKIPNVRYGNSSTIKSTDLGGGTDIFKPNFNLDYCFAVGVNYYNVYSIQEMLLYNNYINLLKPCSLLPARNGINYPIVFDFINKQLSINNLYIVDTSNSFKVNPGYSLQNKTLAIDDFPKEGYYVVYLLFNPILKDVELIYSNGESLIIDMKKFEGKLVICYGLTDGKTYFTFGNINENYVKAIVKSTKNIDNTIDDDKIIPKYAEKKIITSLLQKNRWFDKKANVLGDSVIKGENSADSYKRMKDDNIACILMEEFGFDEVRNYGIGGSRITSHGGNGMVERYANMSGDAILNIVSGGTNDFGGNVEMGSLDNLSDNTKFKPALYNLLKGMQEKYPGTELYYVTPTHRNDGTPDTNKNSVGLTLKDYVNASYEVCELLSVPVIDMWKELGFSPHVPTLKNTFMTDGLHPTIRGMREYYGKKICKSIK